MPIIIGSHNGQYYTITTAGTTTINPNQGAQGIGVGVGIPGACYGANVLSIGTATGTFTAASPTLIIYDIIPAQGTSAITTNTIFSGTATYGGQSFSAGVGSIGVRYRGALVAVTAVINGTG